MNYLLILARALNWIQHFLKPLSIFSAVKINVHFDNYTSTAPKVHALMSLTHHSVTTWLPRSLITKGHTVHSFILLTIVIHLMMEKFLEIIRATGKVEQNRLLTLLCQHMMDESY